MELPHLPAIDRRTVKKIKEEQHGKNDLGVSGKLKFKNSNRSRQRGDSLVTERFRFFSKSQAPSAGLQ